MINITEIINTDCYIDCGDNEKLREVVKVFNPLNIDQMRAQESHGIHLTDVLIRLSVFGEYSTLPKALFDYPTHHINDIIF
jgi:hypothetical protein